ncbi:MoxR family ATPase [Paracrocinitomix mangrovi]|uniref:AAA family ATPase n=1 Tax=Paracrocinitomix mangrovi TaxID=2862509 RepID=UPI001C8E1384|nr:MoxR family ATPase [Paracrocinitomix mangrovi]UKN03864.1 MoxR family ATPase [Paracrocinitomix mangrovi]
MFGSGLNLGFINEKVVKTREEIGKYVIGQKDMVDLLMIAIFANGHVLLEGVPGVAKTLTAKVLAKTLDVDFARIQFTPDLMPSDVIGTSVYNLQNSEFSFKKGPVFSNIVLIDEINRAPAKTQAALFEVMEERQISYDGELYKMDFPFLVLATQNPVEQEGTYNLPEAQLDRFLFKIKIDYPSLMEEEAILHRYKSNIKSPELDDIKAVFTPKDLNEIQSILEKVRVENQLLRYIAEITDKTRNHAKLYLGGSPRASLSMLKSAKAFAAIRGRDFVIPDDVQFVANHVLNHRLIMTPEAEMEGITIEEIIQEIVAEVEVPR